MDSTTKLNADSLKVKGLSLQVGSVLTLFLVLSLFNLSEIFASPESSDLDIPVSSDEEFMPFNKTQEVKSQPQKVSDIADAMETRFRIKEFSESFSSKVAKEKKNKSNPVVQISDSEREDDQIFTVVEEMPEFPGGDLALRKFISAAIKYPPIAQENGVQGKVLINFVVDRDGTISRVKVVRSVNPSLDREALRVVSTLPKWKPGKYRGKEVRCSYMVPISFQLQ